jgi:intein-like protein with splicing domain
MIAMRVCYLLLCLKSPQAYYAMPEQDSIHCLNVASSSRQAQRAFFAPMRRAVQRPGCWFQRAGVDILDAAERQRRGSKGERTATLLDTIRFEHNIEAVSGHSDADSQEGLNLILGIADEIDAFRSAAELSRNTGVKQRESSASAESILAMLRTSASTRFPSVYKNVHISYPRYLGSTIQQLVARGRADNEAKGESSRYYVSGPLTTWEANPRIPGKEAFADDYETDPAMAEAKYECKPRRAVNPYFANEAAIRDCCFEVAQQPVSVGYVREAATWKPVYTFSPDFYPVKGAVYAVHSDLAATGDRAGVAMAHVKRWQDHALAGSDEEGLEIQVKERRPVVKVDFVLSYEADAGAVPPREIQIRWARMLFLELRRMGFPIVRATYDQWQCILGDVKIPLLDGTAREISELAGSAPFWLYSMDREGNVVPGLCTKAWCTGQREDMLEVELDSGEKVTTTSDHRWMMRDGTYCRADELGPGDSLMPLYRRGRQPTGSKLKYEQVWHPGLGKWEFTHRAVSRSLGFGARGGEVIHHGFDGLKHRNNDPGNLRRMTRSDHAALHRWSPEARAAQHLLQQKLGTFKRLWKDPDWSAAHKKRLAARRRTEKGLRTGRDHNSFRHEITFEAVREAAEQVASSGAALTRQAVAERLGCSFTVDGPVCKRVKEAGFTTWKEFKWSIRPRSADSLATALYKERVAAGLIQPRDRVAQGKITFDRIRQAAEQVAATGKVPSLQAVGELLGCDFATRGLLRTRVLEAGFHDWREFRWSVQPRSYSALAHVRYNARKKPGSVRTGKVTASNHKVVAVRPASPGQVYDLQVDKYHNFAVAAGVFVHNSRDSQQILETHGIETDRFSTDVSEEGWRTLRDVMYEGRLEMPSRELVITELLGLSRLPNGKIDHLGDSSKDEADGLAGAVDGALRIGGQEDPAGRRAYLGQAEFYGPPSEIPSLAGMPSSLAVLGPDRFLPDDRPGLESGGGYLDDWGPDAWSWQQ